MKDDNNETILVCVGTSPYGARLVHLAHQMSSSQETPWHVVYVESRNPEALAPRAQNRTWSVLQLAESLGGMTAVLTGPSPAKAILSYARTHDVTQIIIGQSDLPPWRRRLGLSVVDRLLRRGGDMNLFVARHPDFSPVLTSDESVRYHSATWKHYAAAVGLAVLATVIGLPARGLIAPSNFMTSYLLALVISAVYMGFGPAALTGLCAIVAFDFFYLPPYYRLAIPDWGNLLPLISFLVIAGVITTFVNRSRRQAHAARQREAHTHALYRLSRDLAASTDMDAVLTAAIEHWCHILGGEAAVLLPDDEGCLRIQAESAGFNVSPEVVEMVISNYARIQSSSLHIRPLSDTIGISQIMLKTSEDTVGVLLAQQDQRERPFSLEQDRLTEVFANQVALAIERIHFARQARETEMLKATEALQTAILNAVSHDLRTPLSSITGVLSTLDEEAELLSEQAQHELVGTALSEAQRLNHLVGNLLDISRIQADALHLTEEFNDVQDLVGSVLVNLEPYLEAHPIKTSIPDSLPLVPMDFVLISRILHNVIDNAIKYTPEGAPIEVSATLNEPWLEIRVADRGPGLPPKDLERVFDMFYRSSQTGEIQGTGLGLAISRGIVKAHGGRIWAENRSDGGLRVSVALPLSESIPHRSVSC